MTAPDIFALGGRQDDDAEILALFREWCAAHRACESSANFATDAELEVACDRANHIAERVYDAPVYGATGLAIKVYMAAYQSEGIDDVPGDTCALGAFGDSCYARRTIPGEDDKWADVASLYMTQHAMRGLLASAAQFVPELRPLVARAIESPLTLPVDDADDRS